MLHCTSCVSTSLFRSRTCQWHLAVAARGERHAGSTLRDTYASKRHDTSQYVNPPRPIADCRRWLIIARTHALSRAYYTYYTEKEKKRIIYTHVHVYISITTDRRIARRRLPVHPAFETDHRPTDHPPVRPSTSSFPARRGAASPRHEPQETEVHRRFHSYVHTSRTGCATYRTLVPGTISIHRQRAELGEEPAAVAAAATARKWVNTFFFFFYFLFLFLARALVARRSRREIRGPANCSPWLP